MSGKGIRDRARLMRFICYVLSPKMPRVCLVRCLFDVFINLMQVFVFSLFETIHSKKRKQMI